MALTDKGCMFSWGRWNNGRQGYDAQATVELPQKIHLPGGSERWHPICIAAGGRHSMCMTLPRHTVNDHERRLTEASDLSFLGRRSTNDVAGLSEASAPRQIGWLPVQPLDLRMN
jgi:hypothetical protein